MQKNFLIIACVLAVLAVILGAFGAHGLKPRLSPDQLGSFETGIRYQFYHAFALFITVFLFDKYSSGLAVYAGYAFTVGVVLFSGSIYLLATRELIGLSSYKWLGPITPLGGTFLIVGWLLLLVSVINHK